jgi:hypothetical protein
MQNVKNVSSLFMDTAAFVHSILQFFLNINIREFSVEIPVNTSIENLK